LANNKYSSLLGRFISYEENWMLWIGYPNLETVKFLNWLDLLKSNMKYNFFDHVTWNSTKAYFNMAWSLKNHHCNISFFKCLFSSAHYGFDQMSVSQKFFDQKMSSLFKFIDCYDYLKSNLKNKNIYIASHLFKCHKTYVQLALNFS
jgi:hypothetical protein